MTYVWICLVFLAVTVLVAAVAYARARRRARWLPLGLTLAALVVLTAVFDNVMIALDIMDYSPDRRLGPTLGLAPLEDFAYVVAAVILLPALWEWWGAPKRDRGDA